MAYTSIVCGVTGSAHAQKAALEAAVLAKENNAQLTYVYALDIGFLRRGLTVQLSSEFAEESMMHLGDQILEHSAKLAESQGVHAKKIVRKGPVLEVLRAVVSEEKADLLVLGHEERTFFEKAFFKGDVEDHVQELEKQTGVQVTVIK
jgi:nucleotide-binding universal stress UspA family protein